MNTIKKALLFLSITLLLSQQNIYSAGLSVQQPNPAFLPQVQQIQQAHARQTGAELARIKQTLELLAAKLNQLELRINSCRCPL